jgi:hypothetical protein
VKMCIILIYLPLLVLVTYYLLLFHGEDVCFLVTLKLPLLSLTVFMEGAGNGFLQLSDTGHP